MAPCLRNEHESLLAKEGLRKGAIPEIAPFRMVMIQRGG
jgi:hypothetical protein